MDEESVDAIPVSSPQRENLETAPHVHDSATPAPHVYDPATNETQHTATDETQPSPPTRQTELPHTSPAPVGVEIPVLPAYRRNVQVARAHTESDLDQVQILTTVTNPIEEVYSALLDTNELMRTLYSATDVEVVSGAPGREGSVVKVLDDTVTEYIHYTVSRASPLHTIQYTCSCSCAICKATGALHFVKIALQPSTNGGTNVQWKESMFAHQVRQSVGLSLFLVVSFILCLLGAILLPGFRVLLGVLLGGTILTCLFVFRCGSEYRRVLYKNRLYRLESYLSSFSTLASEPCAEEGPVEVAVV